jgi:hypothetical protein
MVEDLRQQLERLTSGRLGTTHLRPAVRRPSRSIEELVGGEVALTDHGPCVLVDSTYPAGHRHGRAEIATAWDLNQLTLAALFAVAPRSPLPPATNSTHSRRLYPPPDPPGNLRGLPRRISFGRLLVQGTDHKSAERH